MFCAVLQTLALATRFDATEHEIAFNEKGCSKNTYSHHLSGTSERT
jgi:hypothetical protein